MKLLMRPKPEKGESFIGYLVRLTELNGYDTPSWLLSLAGIDYMELQWTFSFVFGKTKRLERLARLTNNTLNDLNALVYSPANSSQGNTEYDYDFYGAPLNRSIIRPHHPKICPKCLAEFGYCFRMWECSLVTACPIHECTLIDSCPTCRRQIRPIRKSVSICSCGCDWRELDTQFLSADELAVSRRIYRLCDLSKTPEVQSENPLHSLGLRDLVVVLTFIAGAFRNIAWATGRPSKSIELPNGELHQLYYRAYSVFENWPHNFHQFLSKQSSGQVRLHPDDGRLDTALKREFGTFYEQLYQDLDQGQFDFMRESFAQFLTDRLHSQCQPAKYVFIAPTAELGKCVSLHDARRLLKITNRALFDLITEGEIRFGITNGIRSPEYSLDLADIERLKREFETSISVRDLAKQLSVDCDTIRDLAKKSVLKTRWRPAIDGFRNLRFRHDAAEEFKGTRSHAQELRSVG